MLSHLQEKIIDNYRCNNKNQKKICLCKLDLPSDE